MFRVAEFAEGGEGSVVPGQLQIQIHPARSAGLDISAILAECAALAAVEPAIAEHIVEEGEDVGRYINIDFRTSSRCDLWRLLLTKLYQHEKLGGALAASSMVICTGSDGWNDYLLLHHYDRTLQLDNLSVR